MNTPEVTPTNNLHLYNNITEEKSTFQPNNLTVFSSGPSNSRISIKDIIPNPKKSDKRVVHRQKAKHHSNILTSSPMKEKLISKEIRRVKKINKEEQKSIEVKIKQSVQRKVTIQTIYTIYQM